MHSSFLLRATAAICLTVVASTSELPTIDLGYSVHRANSVQAPSGCYNFSNIRYGESTEGPRRFLAPVPVQSRNSTIDDGLVGRICPQAQPAWFGTAPTFVQDYLTGQQFTPLTPSNVTSVPVEDPRTTEDCLFLDVIVPEIVLNSSKGDQAGAPVLVWIYGGGYVFGEKTGFDPSGLLANSPEPFIFVAMNYRLGAFGFLGGPTVQASATAQPGLLDQRLALDWVQQHIGKFGGSPNRVTVMGESAGGGSIMHQITAYAGTKGPVPFSRAILQSPAFTIQSHPDLVEKQTQALLHRCNVSSIQDLQKLPTSAIIAANRDLVAQSDYGTFTFGPSVDSDFTPSLPGVLLAKGKFDRRIEVLLGHNTDEGLLFTSPATNSSTGLASIIEQRFPEMPVPTRSELLASIYPESAFTGREASIDRAKQVISDSFVTCNDFFLRVAFQKKSSAYEFAIPPGLHGSDVAFTFAGRNVTSLTAPQIVKPFQTLLMNFANSKIANWSSNDHSHSSGHAVANTSMLVFGTAGVTTAADDTINRRCQFWLGAQFEGHV